MITLLRDLKGVYTMKEILSMLQDPQRLAELSNQLGVGQDEVQKVAGLGIPTLVEALNSNAHDEEGAQSLAKALNDHVDDDPTDLAGFQERFIGGGEGDRMMNNIFSGNSNEIFEAIAEKTGMKPETVKRILSIVGPLLLAKMASEWSKKKKEQTQTNQEQAQIDKPEVNETEVIETETKDNPFNPEDVREVTKKAQEETRQEADGSIIDIVKDILGSQQKSGGGGILGDILGGILGKK